MRVPSWGFVPTSHQGWGSFGDAVLAERLERIDAAGEVGQEVLNPARRQLLAGAPALRGAQPLLALAFQRHAGSPGIAGLVQHPRQVVALADPPKLRRGQVRDQIAPDEL